MKRYTIAYQDKNGSSTVRQVIGEIAASAALAALLVKIDYWDGHHNVSVREERVQEYRTGEEQITIWVGF